jgi:hypothetical protein
MAAKTQNPGWHRGFAQSTWRLVAFPLYCIGTASSSAVPLFVPVALDGAGYGAALLWGGQQ